MFLHPARGICFGLLLRGEGVNHQKTAYAFL